MNDVQVWHFRNSVLAEMFANELMRAGHHTAASAAIYKVNLALVDKCPCGPAPFLVRIDAFGDVSLHVDDSELEAAKWFYAHKDGRR